jgi:hypothetical protein
MSTETPQEALPTQENWDVLTNVRHLPLPGQDRQLGLDKRLESLQQRVNMLEGVALAAKAW